MDPHAPVSRQMIDGGAIRDTLAHTASIEAFALMSGKRRQRDDLPRHQPQGGHLLLSKPRRYGGRR